MATQRAFQSNLDATKLLSIDIDGLTTATERVVTFPDQNYDLGINGMATSVTPVAGDLLLIYDASGGVVGKVDASNFLAGQAVTFIGGWDASAGTFPGGGTASVGDLYVVTTGGTVDGVTFAAGDSIYAQTANASTGTFASNWVKVDSSSDVNSVFGRTGVVTAQAGDYTASQITNVAAGNIAAVTVQAAIDELDSEKLASSLTDTQIFVGNGSNVATGVAMSGDATIANTGALTIANDAVSYAKMQNVSATQRLVGRNSAGAGDPEEVTASQVLSWISATQGDVLYHNGTDWVALGAGTAGQFLTTGGAGANPSWTTGASVANASNTVAGISEKATSAEVLAGTATGGTGAELFVGPADLAANYTLTTTLASTANGAGASLIGIEDSAGNITATNVEAALAELAAKQVSATETVQGYTELATDAEMAAAAVAANGGAGPLVAKAQQVAFHSNAAGTSWALRGTAQSATSTGWTVANLTSDKTIDCNAETLQSLSDIVGSLITEFLAKGILSA